jgi:hypothetical protein
LVVGDVSEEPAAQKMEAADSWCRNSEDNLNITNLLLLGRHAVCTFPDKMCFVYLLRHCFGNDLTIDTVKVYYFKYCCAVFVIGFKVLAVVVMKSCVFWDIMLCSLLKVN